MRRLELRRHAPRERTADRLSPEGEALAERIGHTLEGPYDAVFSSPARRAAETVAWFLRAMGQQLPQSHGAIPGLAGSGPVEVGRAIVDLLDRVPEGGRGLAVGHTPLIEQGVEFVTGTAVEPLRECEGVLLVEEDGRVRVDREYRRDD